MTAKVIQYEGNLAVVIDKPIMDKLNITTATTFQVKTDGENLILAKQSNDRKKQIISLIEEDDKVYGKVYEKLAK